MNGSASAAAPSTCRAAGRHRSIFRCRCRTRNERVASAAGAPPEDAHGDLRPGHASAVDRVRGGVLHGAHPGAPVGHQQPGIDAGSVRGARAPASARPARPGGDARRELHAQGGARHVHRRSGDERFRRTPATAHHHYTRARKGGGPGPIRRHRCRRHAANDACGRRAVRGFVAARRRRRPRPRNGRVGRRRHARGRGHVPHPDRPAAGRRPANRFAISGDEAGCSSGAGARQPVARADRHRQRRTSARDDAVAGSVQQLSGVAGADHGERRRHAERRIVRLPARRPADGRELLRAQLDRRASVSGDEPDSHDVHPDGHRRGRCWPSW